MKIHNYLSISNKKRIYYTNNCLLIQRRCKALSHHKKSLVSNADGAFLLALKENYSFTKRW